MAAAMEPLIGVGVQVVNKPGGGGLAAIPDFMAAPADGYTILESIDDLVTNYASNKLDLHPGEDLVPLCMAQITFNQIYIRPDDERFADWDGFVEYAEAHPGEVSLANLGNLGSMERVNMKMLEEAVGIQTNQIAFDEPAARYASLMGGHTDALFEQPGDVKSFLDGGQMKPILTFLKEQPLGVRRHAEPR
jgi:tripartite-type tricarboxylate transporter receptor subunit TctC